jgi:hypothetical protein
LQSKLLFEIMSNNFPNDFCVIVFHLLDYRYLIQECRSQWPRGLRRRSAAAHLLRLLVRIPRGAWMSFCWDCCVSSDIGLCDELITRPEESYQLWSVVVCDLETWWMRRPWPTGCCCAKMKFKKKIQEYPFTIVTDSKVLSSTCDTYCLCTYSATIFRIHAYNLHHAIPLVLRSFILHTYNIHDAMPRLCRKHPVKSSVQLAVGLTYNLVTSPGEECVPKELGFGKDLNFFFETKPFSLWNLNNLV